MPPADDNSAPETAPSDPAAAEELLPRIYGELRLLARGQMAGEPAPQTLTATALVHEAWLRHSTNGGPARQNRRHFYGAAAQAMRRILIERARARHRQKRGGGAEHVELEESQ